ncbi:peptide chain release factor N(5)-glutamine methyltransferase [Aquisediminimonas profunda]|uniref:peptide chain release factor N(5)-glutamine methyltransferase n=1 Tax=Aquisediminimonas profunda TaxID=1550733 RepID=UPI001C62DD05|nr:peptide chain release factor N(5)-glutamine methyltransferase [Aquisediminimonas profunda]
MTLREALNEATQRLASISDTPRLDAELLLAQALGLSREALLLGSLERPPPSAFAELVARRAAHEPIAYITGTRDFWTISLAVSPGVLIPRPDSETLIEAAIDYFGSSTRGGRGPSSILDLGTGSGALLLAALAEWPEAQGLGVDASNVALEVASDNATQLGLASRARFATGNWGTGLSEQFDLIFCNPPYVELDADLPAEVRNYEPQSALFAGADGLDAYRHLIPQLPPLLNPLGMIAVEIGATQAAAVSELFVANGLTPQVRQDLGGRDRAIVHFSLGLDGKGR